MDIFWSGGIYRDETDIEEECSVGILTLTETAWKGETVVISFALMEL